MVVETTRLAAGETTRDGVPKSATMTLRETFQLDDRDGGAHLIVTLTITDPENSRDALYFGQTSSRSSPNGRCLPSTASRRCTDHADAECLVDCRRLGRLRDG